MLHTGATARTLGMVRVAVFAIWLLRMVPECVVCFADFPPFVLGRFGVLRLIPRQAVPFILDPLFLVSFKVVLLALLIAAVLGVKPYRPIAVTAAGMLTIVEGLRRGLAEATHVDLALLYVTFVLAVSPATDACAWNRPRRTDRPPATYSSAMIVMTLLFLLTYALVAAHRLALSSPEIFLQPSMTRFIASDILRPTNHPFLYGEWALRHPQVLSLLQIGFVATTVFELGAPFCLIWPRFRHAWIVTMTAFHVGSYVFMNVTFLTNVLLFPVLLMDLERLLSRRTLATVPADGSGPVGSDAEARSTDEPRDGVARSGRALTSPGARVPAEPRGA